MSKNLLTQAEIKVEEDGPISSRLRPRNQRSSTVNQHTETTPIRPVSRSSRNRRNRSRQRQERAANSTQSSTSAFNIPMDNGAICGNFVATGEFFF
jgi:hypothetical protein